MAVLVVGEWSAWCCRCFISEEWTHNPLVKVVLLIYSILQQGLEHIPQMHH